MKIPRQCGILVGGLGTRLGALTEETPKPLLDCGGRPFLAWVLRELSRFGIQEVVLFAGYKSERVERFCREANSWLPKHLSLKISVEPSPAGTGGALWHARDLLEETFLVINGDSWVDVNLARFFAHAASAEAITGSVLLRSMPDCSRYGRVELQGDRVVALREKSPITGPGLINGGLYIFNRSVLPRLGPACSLERDILPALATEGRLSGCILDGYFIDIGIPSDYERAGAELPLRLQRPAIIFEAGVLLEGLDCPPQGQHPIRWNPGAVDAIRIANDAGSHVFLLAAKTDHRARGTSGEELEELHGRLNHDVLVHGASIDDIRLGVIPDRMTSDEALTAPTSMMRIAVDLLRAWSVDQNRSALIARRGMMGQVTFDGRAPLPLEANILDTIRCLISSSERQSVEVFAF